MKLHYITRIGLVAAATLWTSIASAQPVITSILNNASYLRTGLPGSGIAQGSIFATFGTGMGPAELTQTGFPLPAELAGTSMRISVGGNEVNAIMVYTSAGQLASVLPSNTPVGNGVVRVTYNGQTSQPFPIIVVRNALGLFTLNGAGSGPAVLTDANFGVITYTNAAIEGQTVIAWGTGLAGANFPDNQPAQVFDFQQQVPTRVLVGGKPATLRYAGRSNCCAGLDQIIFDIPEGVRGCNVSLTIRAAGTPGNFTTIPVSGPSRVCSDENGFTEADLNIPADGLKIGSISLTRSTAKISSPQGTIETKSDAASASFIKFDANSFIRGQGAGQASYGSCSVITYSTSPGGAPSFTLLDAGPSLTLTTPGGNRTLNKMSGFYFVDLGSSTIIPGIPLPGGTPPVLEPGSYSMAGNGGADVGAFRANTTLPANFLWTNQDTTTNVTRQRELNITWSGGNPSTDFVTMTGSSTSGGVGATFVCTERASAGQFNVPVEVLSSLPASATASGIPTGSLSVGNSSAGAGSRFTAPGINVGFFTYYTFHTKNVTVD
ncbi:MAG: hypothetical protein JJE04_17915 [Acidobacteriia bacterium]|nr:hypothetical protein [Terriglobia bacterium]